MRKGAGPGRTRDDHLDVAAQTLASLARARQARELGELVGEEALSETDRAYLSYEQVVRGRLLDQRRDESRSMEETLDRAWEALAELPRRELTMIPLDVIAQHLDVRTGDGSAGTGPAAPVHQPPASEGS